MTRKTLRRLGAGGLATAVLTGAIATLAFALNAPATAAFVGTPTIYSGGSGTLTVRVTNPDSALPTTIQKDVNYVRFTPPTQFDITGVTAIGWTATRRDDRAWELRRSASALLVEGTEESPGVIRPGESEDFAIAVTALAQPQDRLDQVFRVGTSEDGAENVQAARVAPGGTLTAAIRILELTSAPAATAPIANRQSFTEGQSNIVMGASVRNHGTLSVDVVAALSGSNGDGQNGAATPVSIAPGSSATVTAPAKMGTPGTNRTMTLTAQSGSTSASLARATSSYVVQTRAVFSHLVNATNPALTPTASNSEKPQTFKASFSKVGEVSCTNLDGTSLNFTSATRSFSATPVSPSTCAVGSTSQQYSFGPTTIPGSVALADFDGTYTPVARVRGVDSNGWVIDQTIGLGTATFRIDNIAPIAEPALTTPNRVARVGDSRGADNGQPYVTRNGQDLILSGTVTAGRGSTALDGGVGVSCVLDTYNASSPDPVLTTAFNPQCTNSGGTLAGSESATYPADAEVVRGAVTTNDGANAPEIFRTAAVVVDNVAPELNRARTLTTTKIRVTLNEPVTGEFKGGDFTVNIPPSVAGGTPTGIPVSAVTFFGSTTQYGNVVDLVLGTAIGQDSQPQVGYRFLATGGTAPIDAPGNAMVANTVTAVDGIAPALAELTRVNGKAADAAGFHANGGNTTFTAGPVSPQHRVVVYRDLNGIAGFDPADAKICEVTNGDPVVANPSDQTCTGNITALLEGSYPVSVQAFDLHGNPGPVSVHLLVVDRAAAEIIDVTVDPATRSLLVTFSEPLVGGKDHANDWQLIFGDRTTWTVGTVSTVGDPAKRRLTVVDEDFRGEYTQLRYVPGTATAYEDRAGNRTPNQTWNAR
jgi:P pilus assembly chaperone PapD